MVNGLFGDPQAMGLLGAAGGLLQAGGPQRQPTSFGQALGQGLTGGMSMYENASQAQNRQHAVGQRDALLQLQLQKYLQEAQKQGQVQSQLNAWLQTLPETDRAAAAVNPTEYLKASHRKQFEGSGTQFAPSPLGKLIAEMNALPEGSPLKPAYESAIKNVSEGQDRNPSYNFLLTNAGLMAGDRRSGVVEPRTLPGSNAPILPPGADPRIQGDVAGARARAEADAQSRSVTPAAQREIIETEEQIHGAEAALSLIGQAKDINSKAMGFRGAGAVAEIGSILPEAIRPETVDATQNLDNILQSSALPQLKAIFGGMPTEGERKILLDIQGSSSKPPKVRAEIFDRAMSAIERRIKFNQEKAAALRGGTYFTGGAPKSIETPQRRRDDSANDPLGLRKPR